MAGPYQISSCILAENLFCGKKRTDWETNRQHTEKERCATVGLLLC